eukprot:13892421-Alexandrium_andersonii.AAC.1
MCELKGSEVAESRIRELRSAMLQSAIRSNLGYWRARSQRRETCELASGIRNLNCAVPETTSNSTPEGLVRG